ncbi:hypothetical protein GJ496_001048 [Pomphorhynchus laevis]|nr:hypothetical protein GJ496_001048 [Pomphorhynchus laevis]
MSCAIIPQYNVHKPQQALTQRLTVGTNQPKCVDHLKRGCPLVRSTDLGFLFIRGHTRHSDCTYLLFNKPDSPDLMQSAYDDRPID